MNPPLKIQRSILQHLGLPLDTLVQTTPVSGGCIHHGVRLLAGEKSYFLKWNCSSLASVFPSEVDGLSRIAQKGVIKTPGVIALGTPEELEGCGYLLLEWISASPSPTLLSFRKLGEQLALHHLKTDSVLFGLDIDNYIGSTPQKNSPTANWVEFFRTQRLQFQFELALKNRLLTETQRKRLQKLMDHLEKWLPPTPKPSLLHGDLWIENVLFDIEGTPILIDPAVYYGDREADLAFTELFHGFPADFYRAYQSVFPLEPEYQERKDLYNLYHLLNHLNIFGASYGSAVDRVLIRFVG